MNLLFNDLTERAFEGGKLKDEVDNKLTTQSQIKSF